MSESDYAMVKSPKVKGDEVIVNVEDAPVGVTLRWSDVKLEISIKDKKSKEIQTKPILKGISGEAYPGELLVIMGPSGAGKSSLMDCLANRNSTFTGKITVNGVPWSSEVSRLASYVLQDDLFYATLTVREHLLFQAELRMGKKSSSKQRTKRVDRIIDDLGLTKCKNTCIGGERLRGISGGERKRLSCASELLTNPSILFVDEPTSGLDSFMAETVVMQLQQLAREGRTIVTTMHQPSSEIYALFDKLLLIADGMLIYHDKASNAVDYFSSIGYQCPNYTNPADYFMRQLVTKYGNDEETKRLIKMKQDWEAHPSPERDRGDASSAERLELDKLSMNMEPLSVMWQVEVLCRRNITRLVKDQLAFKARLGQNIVLSIIIGLIYLQLSVDQIGVQNFTGALFFITVNRVFMDASPEFMIFPLELPIVLREHRSALYRSGSWFFAKNMSEIPFQIFLPALGLIPIYFMVGFGGTVGTYFTFMVILISLSSCATGLGYMVACLTGKPEIASIVGPIVILPFLLFGGLFLNNGSTPGYFIWLKYLSPIKYGFEALMQTFWNNIDHIRCDQSTQTTKCFEKGQDVLNFYELNDLSIALNIVVIIALNIGFRLIAAVGLSRYINRSRK